MFDVDRMPGIRPPDDWRRRLDRGARRAVPLVCTILLMLLGNAPLGIPGQPVLVPAVAVISVFFWSLYRPSSLPPPITCLLGLLLDLLGWLPLGVGSAVLLTVQAFSLRWRRALGSQSIAAVWVAFAGLAAGAAGFIWAATSALSWEVLPTAGLWLQALVTACLYPALAIPLGRANRGIAAVEQA